MEKNACIYVAGHTGLVGSALVQHLKQQGYTNIIYQTIDQLDLTRQQDVESFFAVYKPDYVFLVAAKVGGIMANYQYPADFIYTNLAIITHVIHAAYTHHVKKLLFFGSSCVYPRTCPQPIKEEYLLTGSLEHTNQPYALAKISGIELCTSYNRQYGTAFISCMPTNLYGPRDNFDTHTSHVIPGLISRIYQAKLNNAPQVVIWGSGNPLREFLYVDDMAHAALHLMQTYNDNIPINVSSGHPVTIKTLAYMIKEAIGFKGNIQFDTTQPDGTPEKSLDITRFTKLGWQAHTSLEDGLQKTIDWYITQSISPTKALAKEASCR